MFPTSSLPLVLLEKISKGYLQGSQKVLALDEISFSLDRGEFCILMGPSGCGKSTLINLVGGIDYPDSGRLVFGGRSTREFTGRDWTRLRRSRIGIVFQFFNLLPTLNVYENIALPLVLNGMAAHAVRIKVTAILEKVGLSGKERAFPGELSGGEQQRVAIARAIVHSPELLLADEPTGNLDSVRGVEILSLIRDVSRDNGMTVLMATHSPEAASFGTRLFRMKDGALTRPE